MLENHLYEYAVLRYLPRVEREEFFNVGLVMMCKRRRWIRVAVRIDPSRFNAFGGCLTIDELQRQLDGIASIASGNPASGPIAALTAEERFRWLTAVRSACIRTSRPHPGLTDDLDATFDRLFSELV